MLDLNLNDLAVDNELTADVEYDADNKVSFTLKYIDKDDLTRLQGKCTAKDKFNSKTHQREDIVDYEKLKKEVCKLGVLGWKGVTLNWIQSINPRIDLSKYSEEDLNKEIKFSQDNLMFVCNSGYSGIDLWIFDNVRDAKNFTEIKNSEEELKN